MQVLALNYESRKLEFCEMPEPNAPGPDQVLLRIAEVGVCGTDRDLSLFLFGKPPAGESKLVLGHEAVAQIAAVGADVAGFQKGDWVVPMVRHSCTPACRLCATRRHDLCVTGGYVERGILGLHGFFASNVIDATSNLHRIPAELVDLAVLVEPLSVVEKAWELARYLHRGDIGNVVVLGAGPVGLLAAFRAMLDGARVTVVSRESPDSPRAKLLKSAGCEYLLNFDGLKADVVIEAAGSTAAACQALACLNPLGVMVVLGARNGSGEIPFLNMIVGNQILAGSVNSAPHHFTQAIINLGRMERNVLNSLIERRGFRQAGETICSPFHDAVKVVHRLD